MFPVRVARQTSVRLQRAELGPPVDKQRSEISVNHELHQPFHAPEEHVSHAAQFQRAGRGVPGVQKVLSHRE